MKEIGFIKKLIEWIQTLSATQIAVGGTAAALVVAGAIGGIALSDALDTSGSGNGTESTECTYASETLFPGIGEDETEVTEESQMLEDIVVHITTTSIEKDLKIKIVDENENLVTGFPFVITLTPEDSEEGEEYEDSDMDGIIHVQDIEGGNYIVLLQELEGIVIEENEILAEVKSEIAYEKVEIENEIKDESQINASVEDTANNNVVIETPIVDTIMLVESTVSVTTVPKTQVDMELFQTSVVSGERNEVLLEQTKVEMGTGGDTQVPENSETPDVPQQPENGGTPDVPQQPETGGTPDVPQQPETGGTPDVPQQPETGGTPDVPQQPETGGTPDVPQQPDNGGIPEGQAGETVEPEIGGGSTPVVSRGYSYNSTGVTQTVTVASAKVSIPKMVTLYTVGNEKSKTAEILLNIEDNNQLILSYTWAVSDKNVADLKVADNKMSAVVSTKAEGKTTVVVSFVYKSGVNGETNTYDLVCEVNVVKPTDTETQLKDLNGNPLYLDGTAKQIATPVDFEQATEFYGNPKYTGWQSIDGYLYYYTIDNKPATGIQIIGGVTYEFHEDGTLKESAQSVGIDVSKWQGKIDWATVASAGIDFAIIRCGYRGSSTGVIVEDPYFRENIKGATAHGIKVGVYFFTQAITQAEAIEEASTAIALVQGYKLNFPIFIDTEGSGGRADYLNKADRTAIVKAFCETVRNYGYKPGIYASKYWYYDNLDVSQLSTYNIWVAQYNTECNYSGRYDMWQYTSQGLVPGINGYVDMNICYTKY